MLYKRAGTPFWWVRFRVRGVEVRRSTGTQDRSKAERFEKKLRDDAWDQTRLGIVSHNWDEAVERWIRENAEKRSIKRDMQAFEMVKPYLSGGSLNEINRIELAKLRELIESLEKKRHPNSELAPKPLAPATVLRILSPVRSVLRACVTWGWLTEAPHITAPKIRRQGEPRFITREQFEALANELPPHVERMARFSVETGQRYGSVSRLRWTAVDIKRRHAFISSATSKSQKPIPVPLSDDAIGVLKVQVGKHPEYVFADHKGRAPIGSVKTAWLKAVRRAGLEGFRWHDLRHTWASWHTMNGTPPVTLMKMGGWASLAMVERYSHLSSDHLAQWVEGTKAGSCSRKKLRKH